MEGKAEENRKRSKLYCGYMVQGQISSWLQLIKLPHVCCSYADFGFVEKERIGEMGAAPCDTSSTALLEPIWTVQEVLGWLIPPTAPTWLPSCSNLQAGIISPGTPRSRQEAPGKSKGQEKGMAKKRAYKGCKHGFWELWDTGCRDEIYLHFCREKDA